MGDGRLRRLELLLTAINVPKQKCHSSLPLSVEGWIARLNSASTNRECSAAQVSQGSVVGPFSAHRRESKSWNPISIGFPLIQTTTYLGISEAAI